MSVLSFSRLTAQTILKRVGVYNRIRASRLYDVFWNLTDPRVIDARELEIRVYRQILEGFRAGSLVFDIGANHGIKTDIFLRMGARVIAVDPDESNVHVLKGKFQSLRVRPMPVVIVEKALSDKESVATMWVDEPGSSMNTLNPKWVEVLRHDDARFGSRLEFGQTRDVTTTTLDRLIEIHGVPFFIKIDVEGLEASVLKGLHRPVPFISFEVNLPEFAPEGLECVEILKGVAPKGRFNYTADYSRGLALPEWLSGAAFSQVLSACTERSIEVFWRTLGSADDSGKFSNCKSDRPVVVGR